MPHASAHAPASRFSIAQAAAITLVVAAVYVVSIRFSAFWASDGQAGTPIFPGVGAALGCLLLFGRQYWPAILLGRVIAFAFDETWRGAPLALAISSTNAITAWVGAWLLMRWGRVDPGLTRLRDVLWLAIGGGLGSSLVGATLGVTALSLVGELASFGGTWLRWWLGSVGGVLVVTPFMLAWGSGERFPQSLGYWTHLIGSVAATSVAGIWAFFFTTDIQVGTWLVFPLLLWSSLAFGVRGATLALLPATVIGIAGTTMGMGWLGANVEPGVRTILLQQFAIAASFTCLVLAVVADERRGERAVRDREQRLQMALAAARSFGFDFDATTGRVTRTAECAEILGLSPEEAEGGTEDAYRRLLHEDDVAIMDAAGRALSPQSPTVSFVYRVRRPDGGIVHLQETTRAEFDAAGRITRLYGVTMDITDRRRAELEREKLLARERAAREQAEQATLLRDEFLGTVSHELRTPLNAILGWTQILQAGPRTPDAWQSGLATIARNARLQAQLVDDLLDLSRMSAGRLRLDAQTVDLTAVVREAVLAVTPAASARQVQVQQDMPEAGALVMGDPERLQQVFWNLLVNAVKFTEPGGKVRVSIVQADGFWRARVSDTGQGIAPEFLPHVFDRFRQADGSTTRRHNGLGIGLSLVRQLVEMHGGTVQAASGGQGHGATFTVHLPISRDARGSLDGSDAADGAAPATAVSAPASGLTVLVVDDDADARDVARVFLQDAGARVITAADADDGLRLVRNERPDVVVADIGMPGTDGLTFIRNVRGLPNDEGADTPAVALTALVREEDKRRVLEAGYHSHLAKPVSCEALVAAVRHLHHHRRHQV
ncbi:MAG: MASE1 domain-containing protein [Acidobacteria bacterium]|nr:MASE1 domain-containing protein [Acidobacteriota bacterium]